MLAKWRAERAAAKSVTAPAPRPSRGHGGWSAQRKHEVAQRRMERAQRLVGRRFDSFVVLGLGVHPGSIVIRCDCGTIKEKPATKVHYAKSCGCLSGMRAGRQRHGARMAAPVAPLAVRAAASEPESIIDSPRGASERRLAELREQALASAIAGVAVRAEPQPVAQASEPDMPVADRAVLLAVQRTLAARGYPPTLSELLDAVATPERPFVPVADCLRRLEVGGYIERSQISSRTMKVLRPIAEGN